MVQDLATQYDGFAATFSAVHDLGEGSNRDNRAVFYGHIDFIRPGMKVLDLGCGDGLDIEYYRKLGADVYGLDGSQQLVAIARARNPGAEIVKGDFTKKFPYEDNFFDVVLSKYAIQTAKDMDPCFTEVARVLKPHGTFLYLVTHPFRQFMERKDLAGDYFDQTIVDSHILNDTVVVQEPTHTLNEYFDPCFLARFELQMFDEQWDAAAEQIHGGKYPGYFIVKATRRAGNGG
jgi:ubiquinone/menaquinone biosynthesis C-methylase UbiE